MNNNLKSIELQKTTLPYQKKQYQPASDLYQVDIVRIYAISLHYYLKWPENKVFATSLYKIKQIVVDCTKKELSPKVARIDALPLLFSSVYTEFADIASKEASNALPLNWLYNHKIELDKLNTFSYSPLYKMTTLELEEVKCYLLDNLHKGFITPS